MIAYHKGEIPVFLLLMPFLLGIGLAINIPVGQFGWILAAFAVLCVIFISLNLTYSKLKLHKNRWIGGCLTMIILSLAGYLVTENNNELNRQDHFSKFPAQFLAVTVNNEPVIKNGWQRFTVSVERNIDSIKQYNSSGNLLISLKDSISKLNYGDKLIIPAKYTTVNQPFNPSEFNYKRYLANQNIHYQQFLFPGQYRVFANNNGNKLISQSLKLRQYFVAQLKRNMRDTNAIAVASTLILGYKADLSNDVLQAYSKTGTIHVLSVSGAHVAVIYLMLLFVLRFMNRFKHGKAIRSFIIIIFIWYYAMLTGFSPAVCRAAVMICMVVIGKTYNRHINMLNVMAISAFGLLLYNPLYLVDVGFQLLYLTVILNYIIENQIINKYIIYSVSQKCLTFRQNQPLTRLPLLTQI